jgi:hypothetical protein
MIRVEPALGAYSPAPTRGQHTIALLAELGYDSDAIDELFRSGAFGDGFDHHRQRTGEPHDHL